MPENPLICWTDKIPHRPGVYVTFCDANPEKWDVSYWTIADLEEEMGKVGNDEYLQEPKLYWLCNLVGTEPHPLNEPHRENL